MEFLVRSENRLPPDTPAERREQLRAGERARALELFEAVQRAWDARDRETLATLAGPALMEEWRLRLDDFDAKGWHNRVQLTGRPSVVYQGLVNRAGHDDDRVVVFVECEADDWVLTAGTAASAAAAEPMTGTAMPKPSYTPPPIRSRALAARPEPSDAGPSVAPLGLVDGVVRDRVWGRRRDRRVGPAVGCGPELLATHHRPSACRSSQG